MNPAASLPPPIEGRSDTDNVTASETADEARSKTAGVARSRVTDEPQTWLRSQTDGALGAEQK